MILFEIQIYCYEIIPYLIIYYASFYIIYIFYLWIKLDTFIIKQSVEYKIYNNINDDCVFIIRVYL